MVLDFSLQSKGILELEKALLPSCIVLGTDLSCPLLSLLTQSPGLSGDRRKLWRVFASLHCYRIYCRHWGPHGYAVCLLFALFSFHWWLNKVPTSHYGGEEIETLPEQALSSKPSTPRAMTLLYPQLPSSLSGSLGSPYLPRFPYLLSQVLSFPLPKRRR